MPLGSVSPFRPTGTTSVSVSAVSANVLLSGGGSAPEVSRHRERIEERAPAPEPVKVDCHMGRDET